MSVASYTALLPVPSAAKPLRKSAALLISSFFFGPSSACCLCCHIWNHFWIRPGILLMAPELLCWQPLVLLSRRVRPLFNDPEHVGGNSTPQLYSYADQ